MHITAILQLNEAYRADVPAALTELAQYALDTFGTGGNTAAKQVEDYLGIVQTPVQGPGYLRVLMRHQYGDALEAIQASGGHPVVSLIIVERNGQDMVEVDGEVVEQPITWAEEAPLGGTVTRRLGRIV